MIWLSWDLATQHQQIRLTRSKVNLAHSGHACEWRYSRPQQDFAHVEPDESRWPTWRQLEWPTIPPHMELTSKYTVTLPWCLTLFNQLCWSWKLLTTSNKNTRSHDIRHDITESTITALCPSQKMNLYDLSDETALHLATGSEILHRIKPFHLTTAWHRINIYIYTYT